MAQIDPYIDKFYKQVINGKKGNLFTRVDALEELLKNLQVRDVTQYITQIINQNKEIIIPSLLGGVTDPTDETFSGIVISPSGQLIDGVLYSFAIVVDGVVVSGVGDDGTTVIVGGTGDVIGPASVTADGNLAVFDGTTGKIIKDGGAIPAGGLGDVISDSSSSTVGNIVVFSDTDGKHVKDDSMRLVYLTEGNYFYLTDTAAGISTYNNLSTDEPTGTAAEKSITFKDTDGETLIFGWISPAIGRERINFSLWDFAFWHTCSISPTETTTIKIKFYLRQSGGSEASFGRTITFDITDGGAFHSTSIDALTSSQLVCNADDRIVIKFFGTTAETSNIDLAVKYDDPLFYSYIRTNTIAIAVGGDMLKSVYDPEGVEADAFDAANEAYTPAVTADWSGSADPGNTDDALDQLAARLTDEEAKAETDPLSLHLDQSSSQEISGGQPEFLAGLEAGSTNQLAIDASGNFVTTGYASTKNFTDSAHYTGFPDRTSLSLSWEDNTYTLTLNGEYSPFWINGVLYTIESVLSCVLSVAQEAVTGLYWFWITAPAGVPQLNADTVAPGFDKCLVATVYWNTTTSKGILSDERHWFGRDQWMHEYLHETVGARYASGLAGTFTDTTITIGEGEFYDEDIEHVSTEQTTVKVLYHNGDADWAWDILTTPYKVVDPGDDDNLRYNSGNSLATSTNNKYVNYWVFITADTVHPVHVVIGTAEYNTLALARAASVPSLGGLGTAENKLIYKITYQNNGGTPDYQEVTDYRVSSNLPSTGYVATDHGSLSGLADDDHAQYLLASQATDRTTFSTNWTDLTDGNATTLHTHAGISTALTHPQVMARISIGF